LIYVCYPNMLYIHREYGLKYKKTADKNVIELFKLFPMNLRSEIDNIRCKEYHEYEDFVTLVVRN